MTIEYFPAEIFDHIFTFLEDDELIIFGRCSKNCWQLVKGLYRPVKNLSNACQYRKFLSLPVLLQKKWSQKELNISLIHASEIGSLKLCKKLIKKGANNFENALWDPVQDGNVEIVRYLLNKLVNYIWSAPNITIVATKTTITKENGIKKMCGPMIDQYLIEASHSPNFAKVVELLEEKGASDFIYGLEGAIEHDNIEACKYFISKIKTKNVYIHEDIEKSYILIHVQSIAIFDLLCNWLNEQKILTKDYIKDCYIGWVQTLHRLDVNPNKELGQKFQNMSKVSLYKAFWNSEELYPDEMLIIAKKLYKMEIYSFEEIADALFDFDPMIAHGFLNSY